MNKVDQRIFEATAAVDKVIAATVNEAVNAMSVAKLEIERLQLLVAILDCALRAVQADRGECSIITMAAVQRAIKEAESESRF